MKRGFSQIEVLGAVLVVAVGLLSVVASFIYHFRVTSTSYQRMESAALANRLMGAVRQQPVWREPLRSGLNDSPGEWKALNEPPLSQETFSSEELRRYRRNIRARRLSGYNSSLFVVRVELDWNEGKSHGSLVYEALQPETLTNK